MVKDSYICYLADHKVPYRIFLLFSSLRQLKINFLEIYPYPVIIFHEQGFPEEIKQKLKEFHDNIFFEEIKFKPPSTLLPEDLIIHDHHADQGMGMGYRNMCRFFMTEFFEILIFKYKAKYYLRLDTDSVIFEPVTFDMFKVIDTGNYSYGYIGDICDGDNDNGLTDFCVEYANKNNLPLKWKDKYIVNGIKTRSVYNNFEILKLDLFTIPEVINFIRTVDRTGNIYKYRWGDAPLRTFMLSMFVEREQIYRFKNISYIHGAIFMQRFGTISSLYIDQAWVENNDWIGTTLNY